MTHRLLVRIAIAAAIAVVVSSCSEHKRRLPTAPTTATSVPAATPGAAPGATALVLGQTTAQLLTAADPPCGLEADHQPEPCRQFAVTIVRPGILTVRGASPDELTLRVGNRTSWGKAVDISLRVEAGSTYGIAVGLHSGKGTQAFELTATLEPF